MKIGCVKELKNNEYRVGLTPDNVKAYVAAGHPVYMESGAGLGSGFSDDEYVHAGASLLENAAEVWALVDMMVKVKEPLLEEWPLFHDGLILYTYLHLAADRPQMDALLAGKISAVAYETIQEADRSLPCLAPMSQIAGRLSIQEGAKYLEKRFGGAGILLAGVPGTPKLFKRKYLAKMKQGTVFVDVAIDQGGCGESSHVTTHDDPVFIEEGVVHYCVGNMPGAVPRTSTIALTNATLKYGLEIAGRGLEKALQNPAIALGLNTWQRRVTNRNVALAHGYPYTDVRELLK